MNAHENRLLRHPLRIRHLQVLRTQPLTPHMRRIVVGGPELDGFVSAGPDDHVKLFFPNADGAFVLPTLTDNGPVYPADAAPSPVRDYTPRHYDAAARELTLDFVLHGDGPACRWAAQANLGDALVVGGPRGSFVAAADYDAYVLIGDETALPAIGRWLEELPAGAQVDALIEIPGFADRQALPSRAQVRIAWLERNGVPVLGSQLLEDALRDFAAPDGDAFYWVACESARARMMRKFVEGRLNVPKEWLRATGYWKSGREEEAT
ncbi:siderophore-interacting protein [Xanthomonas hyacinthi]|uniref:Siderophore-interacting protein n=1 Tax=Xanthomonas hyacinthi TaxID=56455 RepID=A0A2S7ERN3_9XANT|nr:siderophore-interacting protein [Xanthomonas hyacinthi]KLD74601.1 iron utilization protein [Xanthomonas hyacinthi DSM 19077]PPU95738.1 siderophore-interacting protein [Xanthomonas hyacinthi]QGY76668.1 siderophore-interacting protein [Xanthomonas hyacinthi]